MTRGTRTAGLTPVEAAMLAQVYAFRNKLGTPFNNGIGETGWLRPVDIGGCAQSRHSQTLRGLAVRGLVASAPWASPTNRGRPSSARMYRLSEQGRIAWELYAEHLANAKEQP